MVEYVDPRFLLPVGYVKFIMFHYLPLIIDNVTIKNHKKVECQYISS